jgi:hypothetical protein
LVKRLFALQRKPDAYVFGTEDGRPIKNLKLMWRELFRLAELDYGRSKGLTWHTTRHEFVSRVVKNTGDPVVAHELAPQGSSDDAGLPARAACACVVRRGSPGSKMIPSFALAVFIRF